MVLIACFCKIVCGFNVFFGKIKLYSEITEITWFSTKPHDLKTS